VIYFSNNPRVDIVIPKIADKTPITFMPIEL
jgi:hypothetical protein